MDGWGGARIMTAVSRRRANSREESVEMTTRGEVRRTSRRDDAMGRRDATRWDDATRRDGIAFDSIRSIAKAAKRLID
jgi:hypothetical protein